MTETRCGQFERKDNIITTTYLGSRVRQKGYAVALISLPSHHVAAQREIKHQPKAVGGPMPPNPKIHN